MGQDSEGIKKGLRFVKELGKSIGGNGEENNGKDGTQCYVVVLCLNVEQNLYCFCMVCYHLMPACPITFCSGIYGSVYIPPIKTCVSSPLTRKRGPPEISIRNEEEEGGF